MSVFVQFSGEDQTAIIAVFSCAQDPGFFKNQGQVEEDDNRLLEFLSPSECVADLWSEHQALARSALSTSDTTLMRCYEAGIALPAEWVAYRKALRAIVSAQSGDPTQPLPTRPAYPEGT